MDIFSLIMEGLILTVLVIMMQQYLAETKRNKKLIEQSRADFLKLIDEIRQKIDDKLTSMQKEIHKLELQVTELKTKIHDLSSYVEKINSVCRRTTERVAELEGKLTR